MTTRPRPQQVRSTVRALAAAHATAMSASQQGDSVRDLVQTDISVPLLFEPARVWLVANRCQPWVQIVAICRDEIAARRLAAEHNAGRSRDDDNRWHVESHPCNVVAHVL